jgi:hypothetical protein
MTEQEAAEKWCPFAREVMDDPHPAANRAYDGDPVTKCIASRCMAWRWHKIVNPAAQALQGSGYCGLTGER